MKSIISQNKVIDYFGRVEYTMMPKCKYDIEGFSKDLGLSLPEAADLYLQLIIEIHSETLKLKTFIASQDTENQKRIIHNLKGITGNYRILDVYDLSSKINDLFRSQNLTRSALLLPSFFSACESAISEIQSYFAEKGYTLT